MKKCIDVVFKVIISLLLVSPVLGLLGVFPPPTAEMYSNPDAFAFIQAIMGSHVMIGMGIACILVIVLMWIRREPLAMLLLLPVSTNIVGFHAALDGGLFTAGAIMGNVLFLLNVYFLWKYRGNYRALTTK